MAANTTTTARTITITTYMTTAVAAAAATLFATTTTITIATAIVITRIWIALGERFEVFAIDQVDQWLARITELAYAVLNAILAEILRYQLFDAFLLHRFGDGIRVGG